MDLEERLTPLQYQVTQQCGTEPPFRNEYWDNHEPGLYVDVVTRRAAVQLRRQVRLRHGWPSFTRPLEPGTSSKTLSDGSLGMMRTEVRSTDADSHLGHVFDDGPAPTRTALLHQLGLAALHAPARPARPRATASSLRAVRRASCARPSARRPPRRRRRDATTETAILAGGCFWGMEDILREHPRRARHRGRLHRRHAGARPPTATCAPDAPGHAEAVRIVFDPAQDRRYAELLDIVLPHARPDHAQPPGQRRRHAVPLGHLLHHRRPARRGRGAREARRRVRQVEAPDRDRDHAGRRTFWPAEDYHQDYLEKNPGGYTCHYLRD